MKIVKSCGSPSWGGIEIYVLRTIEALNQLGEDVPILCIPNSNIQKSAREKGIKYLPILSKGFRRISAILKLKKYLRESSAEVIHTHISNDLWILVPALKLAGSKAKLILSKGMESGVSKKDIFHRYLYKRVDAVIPVSNFIKKNVLQTCPVNEDKIRVIHDAVQLEKFDPGLFNRKEIRTQLGFDEAVIIIGMVGRMSPGKGHEIFFKCAKMIMETDLKQKVRFLVVGGASFGEDNYEKKLLREAEEMGLKGMITFAGQQSNIPFYLSTMDILAFPSNEESFGGTALEAMAMKLPVVGFNAGGVTDIIVDGETGFLTPRNDVRSFTDALIKLIKDAQLREKFGNNGRKRVESYFDMREYIKQCMALYGE